MLSTLHSGVSKVIRSSGQALDSIGKRFELNPYTEKCNACAHALHEASKLTNFFFFVFFILFYSATIYTSGKTWKENS